MFLPHHRKPTQMIGFLFIQKIFSSPQFHHHRLNSPGSISFKSNSKKSTTLIFYFGLQQNHHCLSKDAVTNINFTI